MISPEELRAEIELQIEFEDKSTPPRSKKPSYDDLLKFISDCRTMFDLMIEREFHLSVDQQWDCMGYQIACSEILKAARRKKK